MAWRRLGRVLGALAWRFPDGRRRAAEDQLRRAFPDLDPSGRRRLARASFENRSAAAWDRYALRRLGPVALCRRLTLDGWRHLDDAEGLGRGLVVLTARCGVWELPAIAVGLYRGALDLDTELARRCRGFGLQAAGETAGRVAQLEAGGRLGVLAEVVPATGETGVPFLGRRVRLAEGPAELALRTGAPVVPAFGTLAPDGGYRVSVRPAVHPEKTSELGKKAIQLFSARVLEVIEDEVRQRPDLWPWAALASS